jgi:hypothetical protein
MITVNAGKLAEAIREADAFALPEMNGGVSYLYDAVCRRMFRGQDVRLSELDFDAFAPEDVDSLSGLYSDVFERNHYVADGITSTLRNTAPVCKAVGYV